MACAFLGEGGDLHVHVSEIAFGVYSDYADGAALIVIHKQEWCRIALGYQICLSEGILIDFFFSIFGGDVSNPYYAVGSCSFFVVSNVQGCEQRFVAYIFGIFRIVLDKIVDVPVVVDVAFGVCVGRLAGLGGEFGTIMEVSSELAVFVQSECKRSVC